MIASSQAYLDSSAPTLAVEDGEYIDSDTVNITVVDTTAPEVACLETVNPHGKKVPPECSTTLPGPKGCQNEEGFFELLATDICDPDPDIFVVDTGSGAVFGPFSSGTKIKYTEANGATPSIKPGTGVIDWKIKGQGDAAVFAVDAAGNPSPPVDCLVPPPPK